MTARLRLLRGATALLYFGPLLAGIGGFGWGVVPLFLMIFMAWLFVLRPEQWPRRWADWRRPEALIALLTQGVVQLLLVAVSFGIGRGIGGVLGVVPPFPLMLPVAMSFLSIPLARMIWNPWGADPPLDAALAEAEALEDAPKPDLQEQIAIATRMLAELGRVPQDAEPGLLAGHLQAMAAHVPQTALRAALMDAVYDGSAGALGRRAAIVHATDPVVAAALAGSAYPMAVFHALAQSEDLALFAGRCAELLAADPGCLADCPDAGDVARRAGQVPAVARELRALEAGLAAAAAGTR